MKVKHVLGVIALLLVTIGILTFFSSVNQGAKSSGPQFLFDITGWDAPDHTLREPTFAVADQDGDIYVADSGNRRVRVFNRKGRFRFEFGGPDSKKPLLFPYGIGIADGKVIVADTGAGALYEFNSEGDYVKTWVEPKTGVQPAGVFVAPEQKVYVTDMAGRQVLVFSKEGKMLQKISSKQVPLGSPQGLSVNADGTVWVADGGNYNIKLLKPDGELVTIFDGGPARALTMAKGLAVDDKGRIYVADTLSNTVRGFDKAGGDLFTFGPKGEKQSSLQLPVGLSIDSDGRIYVADQGNNKIQVWGWK